MFFKRSKIDKSKAAEVAAEATPPTDAADAAEAAKAAPAPTPTPAEPIEPSLPLGAHMNSAGATDAAGLGFKTTADLKPAHELIGQARALEALSFGAGIKGPGYHMLVVGREGSGRRTAARAKLAEVAGKADRPADWVYVSSFDPTGGFRALKLPAGTAKPFAEKMALAIDQLADALPAAFAADDYDLKRRTIEEEFRFSREDALEALRREAEGQNIALLRTPSGIAVAPVLEGKVVKTDVFNSVPESLRREVETKIAALEAEIEAILTERPEAEKERRARLSQLNENVAGRHVRAALDDLKAEFAEVAGVESYLKAAARDLVRNAGLFVSAGGTLGSKLTRGAGAHPRFARYGVHIMATSSAASGAPIVQEPNPTYANLFGRVELGTGADGQPQVVRIKHGALHRANGGYLLIDGKALLDSAATTEALRRALEAEEIRFDPPASPVGAVGDEVPDLEAIPLAVKLVVFGDTETQRRLATGNPALRRLFKVEAVFEDAVPRTKETVATFARVVAGIVDKHSLRPFDAAAVGLLVDEAARQAGGDGKLSLSIADMTDVCREADHWAAGESRAVTTGADVERVLRQRRARESVVELAQAS
jgi:predicted ATP-dependent protease